MLGEGRWVTVETLRLHYVRGEGGGIGRKHYEKYYVFSLFCETKGKKRNKTLRSVRRGSKRKTLRLHYEGRVGGQTAKVDTT